MDTHICGDQRNRTLDWQAEGIAKRCPPCYVLTSGKGGRQISPTDGSFY